MPGAVQGEEDGVVIAELSQKLRGIPSAAPEPDAWKPDAALALVGGDKALLIDLIGIFLVETPKLMGAIGQAVASEDFDALCRAAHTLKGQIACLSAEPACSMVRKLEEQARARDMTGVQASIQMLSISVERLKADLSAYSSSDE